MLQTRVGDSITPESQFGEFGHALQIGKAGIVDERCPEVERCQLR